MRSYSFLLGRAGVCCAIAMCGVCLTGAASATTINLVQELDGNDDNATSFGMIDLTQNGTAVDITIVANTVSLVGGDIHELYFNLPDTVDLNSLAISNEGGVSNRPIGSFTPLVNPSITGGAGASFDAGVSFGNGGGPSGNGILTTATFTITAASGLLESDFLFEFSGTNNAPDLHAAVHFQSADVFGAGSETIGGAPEPGSLALLSLSGLMVLRRRR